MKTLSIVIPTYNEEGNIKNLYERLINTLSGLPYKLEIIYIDDGSKDGTLSQIANLSEKDKRVKYISFSKNFGHQIALKAGLDYAIGDIVISLDADLQHPPELIPELVRKWEEGFEIVYTIRKDVENVSLFKRLTAKIFYILLNQLSGLNISQGAADFRLLDRKVVDVIKEMKEGNLFIRGMIPWLGFKQFGIEYVPEKRVWGKSKYTVRKMFLFAMQGITSFSVKPLHLTTFIGSFVFVLSLFYIIYALSIFFLSNISIPGWTSLLISVLFLGSINLIMLGIIGEYIGKIAIESKKRPNYIIREKNL